MNRASERQEWSSQHCGGFTAKQGAAFFRLILRGLSAIFISVVADGIVAFCGLGGLNFRLLSNYQDSAAMNL